MTTSSKLYTIVGIAFVSCILNYVVFNAYQLGICTSDAVCLFDGWRRTRESVFEPMFIMSLSLFITAFVGFFISQKIIKTWFSFFVLWFAISILWIVLAPIQTNKMIDVPTKEVVSTFMGTLFVIISLIMFAVMTWRERRNVRWQ